MKNPISQVRMLVTLGAISCLSASAGFGADTTSTPPDAGPQPPSVAAANPVPAEAAPPKLPYGAEDVLKLSRAQVNEEVIINYVQTSGTIYNLAPNDIVYLRNEGVSDHVINTMLDQRKGAIAQTVAPAPTSETAPAPAPVAPDVSSAPAQPAYAPTYVQPPPVEVQPPPSTLYVIPYGSTRTYYSYGYVGPYYYGGYCSSAPYRYYGPRISVGFRAGGRGHFHGGGHHRR